MMVCVSCGILLPCEWYRRLVVWTDGVLPFEWSRLLHCGVIFLEGFVGSVPRSVGGGVALCEDDA